MSTNYFTVPAIFASPLASTREQGLRMVAAKAGVEYPAADTSELDAILAVPTEQQVLAQALREGKTRASIQEELAEAAQADRLRPEVPRMKDALQTQTFPERSASIGTAVVKAATIAIDALNRYAPALPTQRPLDKGECFDAGMNAVEAWWRVTAALTDLGVLRAWHSYPDGSEAFDRRLRLVAPLVTVGEVEKYGSDAATCAVRVALYDLARSDDVDTWLVKVARGDFNDGLSLGFAPDRAAIAERLTRLDAAGVTRDAFAIVPNPDAHPTLRFRGWA